MNTFGDRLRAARIARGFTQEELSDRIQVSKQSISAWENNREAPSLDKLPRLRAHLEASLDELVCGDAAAAQFARKVYAIADSGAAAYAPAPTKALDRDEMRMLRRFRAMPERRRKALIILLGDEGG